LIANISYIIGLVGALFSIISGYYIFYDTAPPSYQIGLILLGVLTFVFMIYSFILKRRSPYADIVTDIHQTYDECYSERVSNLSTETEVHSIGEKICTNIAHIFTIVTSHKCSVCIKAIDQRKSIENQELVMSVFTLCRDTLNKKRKHPDDDKIVHLIPANTDFKEIFFHIDKKHAHGRSFFRNNLPALMDYTNTSFDIWGEPTKTKIPFLRRLRWPLPYKSTIVAAIYPQEPKDDQRLVGFLCVDSNKIRSFKKPYDEELIIDFASSIYPLIMKGTSIVLNTGGHQCQPPQAQQNHSIMSQ
jgi:hypothetical protein